MSVQRFRGAAPPPPAEEVTYQVLRPQKHGPLDVTLCADTVLGVNTHWVISDEGGVGCSMVCYQHEGYCPYHDDRMEWSGWLPVYDHVQRKDAVLRLSPKEYDVLAAVLGCDLRWNGQRVRIVPTNAGNGKRIAVERVNDALTPKPRKTWSIDRTVCLVLRCPRIPRQSPPVEVDPADVPYPPEGGAS